MERTVLKRPRSDEQDYFVPQNKTLVSEKIMASNDGDKMNEVHEKTIKLLFNAARGHKSKSVEEGASVPVPLWQQIRLSGNGEINSSNLIDLTVDIAMELRKADCCPRDTYLRDKCGNCTMPLCEYCGYSCSDCGIFLCHSCVALFGCGTTDKPICDKCSYFHKHE